MSGHAVQDAGVRELSVKLRLVLRILRILAGRRGHAHVAWHGQGFLYELRAVRDPGSQIGVEVDSDDTGDGLGAQDNTVLRERLRELLEVHP